MRSAVTPILAELARWNAAWTRNATPVDNAALGGVVAYGTYWVLGWLCC